MTVYKDTKTGKWYGRGKVNNEQYHRLLEGVKNKSEALEMDTLIRHNMALRQIGILSKKHLDGLSQKRLSSSCLGGQINGSI